MNTTNLWQRMLMLGFMCTLMVGLAMPGVRASTFGCPDVPRGRPDELARVPEGTVQGTRALDFSLPDLSGEPVSLSDLRGCVVTVEFWASWCTPCWSSAAHLDALQRRHEERGFVVLGISLDRSREAIKAFLEGTGHPELTVLWGSYAEAHRVAQAFEVRAIPRALVVDRRGVIRYVGHPAAITDELLAPLW